MTTIHPLRFAFSSLILLHLLILGGAAQGSGGRKLGAEDWSKLTGPDRIDREVQVHDGLGGQNRQEASTQEDHISKEANVLRLHSMDIQNKDLSKLQSMQHTENDPQRFHEMHASDRREVQNTGHGEVRASSSHMDHMDPSVMVFFQVDDLKLGKTMPVYFPRRDPSSSPQFLPREEADSIPFSLEQLPYLLQKFSFSKGSSQAKAMEDTLRQCQTKPIKGETKFCATSLESMLDFVQVISGLNAQIRVLSTTHLTVSNERLQNYTILDTPKEIVALKTVACHTMPYPYAVFYCHYQKSKSRVFKVLLGGQTGGRVDALAVCHMDTSQWSPDHISFRVLGLIPGSSPICHFFPADHLLWVSSSNSA